MVSVQPPIMAMPGLRLTTWPRAFFATKQRSRVSLMCRAIREIASSQEISSQRSDPGLRTFGARSRPLCVMSSFRDAPLGQRVPRLIG